MADTVLNYIIANFASFLFNNNHSRMSFQKTIKTKYISPPHTHTRKHTHTHIHPYNEWYSRISKFLSSTYYFLTSKHQPNLQTKSVYPLQPLPAHSWRSHVHVHYFTAHKQEDSDFGPSALSSLEFTGTGARAYLMSLWDYSTKIVKISVSFLQNLLLL